MKYISPLISDARNKLGGTVWARNASGPYVRTLVHPTQPRTVSQQANRATFAAAATAWRALSQAQIKGWNTLASTTVWTDTLGQQIKPSGFTLFVSLNRNLQAVGLSTISDSPGPPPTFPDFVLGDFEASATGGAINGLFIALPGFVSTSATPLVTKVTRALSPTISFLAPFEYRSMGAPVSVSGDIISYNANWNSIFHTAATGQKLGVKVQVIDPASGWASPELTRTTIIL